MNAEVKRVRFTIDGPWLTELVRTLWADEGEPEKALHILKEGFPDLPQEVVYGVLTGSKKLEGDSTAGIHLVADDATHSTHGNSLALDDVLKPFRKKAEEGRDAVALLAGNVRHISSPKGRIAIPTHRVKPYQRGEVDLDDMLYEGVSYVPTPEERREMLTSPAAELQRREVGLEPDDEEGEEDVEVLPRPPKPDFKITFMHGWLSPDGKFYKCNWMEHIWMARVLLCDMFGEEARHEDEGRLEKLGWIKISQGNAFDPPSRRATMRQRNLVFDYYTEQDKPLPFWWEDGE